FRLVGRQYNGNCLDIVIQSRAFFIKDPIFLKFQQTQLVWEKFILGICGQGSLIPPTSALILLCCSAIRRIVIGYPLWSSPAVIFLLWLSRSTPAVVLRRGCSIILISIPPTIVTGLTKTSGD